MTQSKSRRLLYQQARLIRIQWAIIMALVCTIVLMAIFLPKAKAIEETAVPALELEPTSYVTHEIMPEPVIEAEPEEIEPVLEELGEFRLTAYCACRKCCGKDPGDFGYCELRYQLLFCLQRRRRQQQRRQLLEWRGLRLLCLICNLQISAARKGRGKENAYVSLQVQTRRQLCAVR